jgi:hypothetical protein
VRRQQLPDRFALHGVILDDENPVHRLGVAVAAKISVAGVNAFYDMRRFRIVEAHFVEAGDDDRHVGREGAKMVDELRYGHEGSDSV